MGCPPRRSRTLARLRHPRVTLGDLDYLALIVFGLLAVFLVLVGMGKLLPSKPEEKGIPR